MKILNICEKQDLQSVTCGAVKRKGIIMKNKYTTVIVKYSIITVSSFFYALAVSLILSPNDVVVGGVTGLAMILNRFLPIGIGTLILLINIPILLIGLWKFGFRFLISTIYAIAAVSFFTDLLTDCAPLTHSPILAAVIGNMILAVALAVIFKCHSTTGGMDIIVKLLRIKYPHMKTGKIFLVADFLVVLLAGVIFKDWDSAFCAFIGIMILSAVFDMVLYGMDEAKMIYIISDQSHQIADRIMTDVDAGVTFMNGHGAYSGKNTEVILCVVKKNLSIKIEEIVKEMDPGAFLIITNATEIYGEGYKDIFAGKL